MSYVTHKERAPDTMCLVFSGCLLPREPLPLLRLLWVLSLS
jgi:hypothetical protein